LNGVLRVAGTMYIDGGRPLAGRFDETIANLREVSPTVFGSVPAAYAMLADALERDADLRQNFFKNLRALSYGGALLPNLIPVPIAVGPGEQPPRDDPGDQTCPGGRHRGGHGARFGNRGAGSGAPTGRWARAACGVRTHSARTAQTANTKGRLVSRHHSSARS